MAPQVSVVVVGYDMARELPRTIRSLIAPYQRGVDPGDVEVIVVDNGSPEPVELGPLSCDASVQLLRIDDAPPSPAAAANRGIAEATGALVGLVIDGARLASPGLLAHAHRAATLAERPVVATLGWHLGPHRHMEAAETGWNQQVEDQLLDETDWEADGYRLFGVSTLAASSARGYFGPMGECSALFLRPAEWHALGGLDEAFTMPGGGLVNHDLYRRACALPGAELVMVLGEGTFHQFHGGAATSNQTSWEDMHADYQRIRGEPYRPPSNAPLYVGHVPDTTLPFVEASARSARERPTSRPGFERPDQPSIS